MGVYVTNFFKVLFVCVCVFFFLQGGTLIGLSQKKLREYFLIYNHGGASFLLTFIHCDI
jgi:hypothetical protein